MSDALAGVDRRALLGDAYDLIAALWCSPADVDLAEARRSAGEVLEWLADVNEDAALALARFLETEPIAEEDYIDLFELEPKCALYLGSHVYDEPKSCAGAGVSDRNDYMIELIGVYRHFGRAPDGQELPDYLPLVIDFLGLTAGADDDPVRAKLVTEYLIPFLPPMRKRLEALTPPHLHLFGALEKIIQHDLDTSRRRHVE